MWSGVMHIWGGGAASHEGLFQDPPPPRVDTDSYSPGFRLVGDGRSASMSTLHIQGMIHSYQARV